MSKFTYIYGRHAVKALLHSASDRISTLYLSTGIEQEFIPLAHKRNIKVMELSGRVLRELGEAVHQGVVADVSMDNITRPYADFIRELQPTPSNALVLLNEISDPHNVGAIIRSAVAFGASGVLIPAHNQSPITGAVAKASAGTLFSIPLVSIGNENQTIIDLKKKGFWIYGLAADSDKELAKERFDAPAVFVVGSEGEGMRQKTREHCDIVLKIPMSPRAESLNASVSAAVALSHWSDQHHEALAN